MEKNKENNFQIKLIRAEIFINWITFRVNQNDYDVEMIIRHGIKMVTLGRDLKRLKRHERNK